MEQDARTFSYKTYDGGWTTVQLYDNHIAYVYHTAGVGCETGAPKRWDNPDSAQHAHYQTAWNRRIAVVLLLATYVALGLSIGWTTALARMLGIVGVGMLAYAIVWVLSEVGRWVVRDLLPEAWEYCVAWWNGL